MSYLNGGALLVISTFIFLSRLVSLFVQPLLFIGTCFVEVLELTDFIDFYWTIRTIHFWWSYVQICQKIYLARFSLRFFLKSLICVIAVSMQKLRTRFRSLCIWRHISFTYEFNFRFGSGDCLVIFNILLSTPNSNRMLRNAVLCTESYVFLTQTLIFQSDCKFRLYNFLQ